MTRNNDGTWSTFRMADGSLIWGEYGFVENEEFFEELDEPVKVIKETWVLQSSEIIVFQPTWWDEEEYDELYTEAIEEEISRKLAGKVQEV